MTEVDYVFKLLTLGESSVGKSSIILRFTNNQFNDQLLSTTGIDFRTKIIDYKEQKIKLVIYDTSGQERYRTIAANYYKNADGILFVYDITNENSLTFKYWLEQIQEKSSVKSIILFGNKTDLENVEEEKKERKITFEEGKKIADQYGLKLFEGSAKQGININEAIEELVGLFYKEKKLKAKGEKKEEKKQNVKLFQEHHKVKKNGCCKNN
jgi:small GTP-binding protein